MWYSPEAECAWQTIFPLSHGQMFCLVWSNQSRKVIHAQFQNPTWTAISKKLLIGMKPRKCKKYFLSLCLDLIHNQVQK